MRLPETTSTPATAKVWDPLVRLFHWSLVAAFAVAWLTGDEASRLHELAGYAVIGLVLVRLLWGLVGTRYARFSDFVHRPSTVLAYAREMPAGKPRYYLGHNPLGGVMILARGQMLGKARQQQRGTRLDESIPGQGLGLAIAMQTGSDYGGRIDFGRSEILGGFLATLHLPAAGG